MVQVPTCSCGSGAASGTCDCLWVPLDREKVVVTNAPVTLIPPPGTRLALVENIPVPSNGRVRWTDTGVPPVGGGAAGFGHFLIPGATIAYPGDVGSFTMVRDGSQNATVEITYYDYTP